MNDNSNGKKVTRHEEREQAFVLLFEQIFQEHSIDIIVEDAKEARDIETGKYALKLAKGVEEKREELDAVIESNLKGWKMNRISKVSLTVLRIAVYEMMYEKTVPVSVAINEAVELSKKYATKGDAKFVNGVLGAAVKSIDEDK